MTTIKVQGSPNIYRHHEGALVEMKQIILRQGFNQGLLVTGEKSWQQAGQQIDALDLPLKKEVYRGECSRTEVERLKQVALAMNADYLLAVGGGKVIDVTKATAASLGLPYVIVPTLASNCAAFTPLSVFYTDEGVFTDHVVFDQAAFMVAVEPRIILTTPKDYLRAGIGDTLAKWYEAKPLVEALEEYPVAVEISQYAAKLCRDVLIDLGEIARTDHHDGKATAAFTKVVDAIIMASGMVGGFGEHYGRISGAHSIHNGLTVLSETHAHLHGDKVAYGILVQLALFEAWEDIDALLPFYHALGLPTAFSDLNIGGDLLEKFNAVAVHATKPGESIHLLGVIDHVKLADAMHQLETYVQHTD